MKKVFAVAALAVSITLSGNVLAHGAKAKHGGIVQSAGDLAFELVAKDGNTTIYVDDHGKELPTAGASGTLTVLKGTQKTAMPLEAGQSGCRHHVRRQEGCQRALLDQVSEVSGDRSAVTGSTYRKDKR
jgi:hypothetical protein